jgi:hypothetical protein
MRGRIDPDGARHGGWFRGFADEAVRGFGEGLVEGVLSLVPDDVDLTVVDLIGGQEADADVMVISIVPAKEVAAERPGLLDGLEALRKLWLVFQGLELRFGERVVVGGMGAGRGIW